MLQQVQLKLVTTGLVKILNDLKRSTGTAAAGGMLAATYLGLFVAPFPGFALNLGEDDVVPPTFGGYARVLATWSANGIDPSGRPEVFSQGVLWTPSDSTGAATILGMALFSALTEGDLYGVGLLPTPVELNTPSDMATLVARFQLPLDPADWGRAAMVN